MKAKVALIILVCVVLGLGIGLVVISRNASEEKTTADAKIAVLNENVTQYQSQLEQERVEKMGLQTNFAATKVEFSNKLAATEANLSTTAASLAKAQADAKAAADAAAAEMAQRDKKIGDLEIQNQSLDKTALDLRGSITNLESQISITEKKLATSEGDRQFLLTELKRLQAEKADLEKKFNDLAVLREQVHKLKEELALSRRLDWIRRGLYATAGEKGGQRMITTPTTVASTNAPGLNVELRQDGGVKIQPSSATNAPVTQ